MTEVFAVLGSVSVVLAAIGTTHVLLHYRRPATAVAWIFAMWALVLVGSLAYFAFAVYEGPRSIRKRRRLSRTLRKRSNRADAETGYEDSLQALHFRRLADRVCSFPMTADNAVDVLATSDEALEDMLDAIDQATDRVWLQTYILRNDAVTRRLFERLANRADAGVDVRLLIDPIGSVHLPQRVLDRLADRGVACATFLKPSPLKGRLQINFRNHRKILVVDSRVWTGGRNWGVEYFGENAFRDLTVRLRGSAVAALARVFLEDWVVATGEGDEASIDADLADVVSEECAGDHFVRVVPHGCDEQDDAFVTLIAGAFRAATESILVVTPYFIPGRRMLEELRIASLGGIRVTLLMPAESPERSARWAARRYFPPLLDAGVEVRLLGGSFLHAKAIIVDDRWSTFGSANFDHRSLYLNYELNVEVPGPVFAKTLRDYFASDLESARAVTKEDMKARSIFARVLTNAAALFEPIL